MLALLLGEDPPEDRSCLVMASKLLHAARTGDFPWPGGLEDQPDSIRGWFHRVHVMLLASERAAAGLKGI